jgi:predicted DNA-binding transcriptional regulator AlpA
MTGRPPTSLSEAQRVEVETLAAVLNAEQIADFLGIGRTTFFALLNRDSDLCERYRKGKARAVGAVAQSLVTKARAGNVTAMIFFLKTQGGWRETVEVAPPRQEGTIDLTGLSDETLHEMMAVLQKAGAEEMQALDLQKGAGDGGWSVP